MPPAEHPATMLHRTTDPASRSPFQSLVACLVAAIVCGYTGHYGMTLLAVGIALLAARRLAWPRPVVLRTTALVGQAGWVVRASLDGLVRLGRSHALTLPPRRILAHRALPVRALHLSR